MPHLKLIVLSLRYSSWSMRPWLALTHAGAHFETHTVELPDLMKQAASSTNPVDLGRFDPSSLATRRALGSVHGLFPVLRVDSTPIHESLAICEYVAENYPNAGLWPQDGIERALARAVCCELVSGFVHLRGELSSHLFARVPGFRPSAAARSEISRVFELWSDCLSRSGGPFLFGDFTIADAMYFPVMARFATYDVALPNSLHGYAQTIDALPAVQQLIDVARRAPRIPVYDDYVRQFGGDPDAALGGFSSH